MHDFYISIFRWNFWSKYLSWKLGWNEEKIVWSLYKYYAVCITLYHHHFLLHCNYSKIGGESGTSTRSSKVLTTNNDNNNETNCFYFFSKKVCKYLFEKNVCSIHPTIISLTLYFTGWSIWYCPILDHYCRIFSLISKQVFLVLSIPNFDPFCFMKSDFWYSRI